MKTKKTLTSNFILNSVKSAIDADQYLEVTIDYDNARSQDFLELHWIDCHSDEYLIVKSDVEYVTIINHDNRSTDIDISSIKITEISIGDGYDQAAIIIPGDFNEHTISPLLTVIFDKSNDALEFGEGAYSVNLISESSDKRGSNWIMTA